jgi:hypothetical protein
MAVQANVRTKVKRSRRIEDITRLEVRLVLGILACSAGFYLFHFLIMYALFGGFNTDVIYRLMALITFCLLVLWYFVCRQKLAIRTVVISLFVLLAGFGIAKVGLNLQLESVFMLAGYFILTGLLIFPFMIGPFFVFTGFALIGGCWVILYHSPFNVPRWMPSLRSLRVATGATGISVIFFLFSTDNSGIMPRIDAYLSYQDHTYYLITEERQADSASEVAHVLFECNQLSLECWDIADEKEYPAREEWEFTSNSHYHSDDEILTLTVDAEVGIIRAYRDGVQIIAHRPGSQIPIGRSLLGMRDHMYLNWHWPPICQTRSCLPRQR